MMKINVDQDRCVGQGLCLIACPGLFELSDEDGRAIVSVEIVPPEFEEAVRHAERSCPERAIVLSD